MIVGRINYAVRKLIDILPDMDTPVIIVAHGYWATHGRCVNGEHWGQLFEPDGTESNRRHRRTFPELLGALNERATELAGLAER